MRQLLKIFTLLASIAVICGAPFFWRAHKKTDERKLVHDAQAYRARAEQGDAISQYELALMYHQGKGMPQNYGEALRWYRKAADQGNAKAEYGLGYMYDTGEGVPQD